MLTRVGADAFGDYIVGALDDSFAVDTRFISRHPELLTPLAFAELADPAEPTIIFYRAPEAPDMTIDAAAVPADIVRDVPILWIAGSCVSGEPSRSTIHELLAVRGRRSHTELAERGRLSHTELAERGRLSHTELAERGRFSHTVLDLDWRPHFWSDPTDAGREIGALLDGVTMAIGNRTECEVVVGTSDPHRAADRLLERGLEAAIVKMGGDGVLVASADGVREEIPPYRVDVVCGLGAGDAFGGAVCHGLLAGWDLARCARAGNAAGAIVASRLMCADDMPYLEEIEAMLEDRS